MINPPKNGDQIIETLNENGFRAVFVGGCVRDMIMGREPKDWDIATAATPEQVKALFDHVILTGEKHGTVTVMMGDEGYEVTTFRVDGSYSDGRHPDTVTHTYDLGEDLARRDFTMNAIAYFPRNGAFYDPYDGIEDIKKRTIRAVGKANDRFKEDALRMMRAIRFSSQLQFNIEGSTMHAITKNRDLLKNVSQERLRDELSKILVSPEPEMGIGTLAITQMIDSIIPELIPCLGFNQHSPYHKKDVFDHIMDVVGLSPNHLKVRLAALFHDIGKPDTFSQGEDGIGHFYGHPKVGADIARNVMTRLRFPNDLIEDVCTLVLYHMDRVEKLRTPNIKRFMNRVGEHNLPDLFALMRADIAAHKGDHDYSQVEHMEAEVARIIAERPPMVLKDLAINGKDLIAMGMKPGPVIGSTLKLLMDYVIENPDINTVDGLKAYLDNCGIFPVDTDKM